MALSEYGFVKLQLCWDQDSRASIGVFRAAQLVLMEVPAESIVTDRGLLCYRCQGSGIKCGVLTGPTGLGSSACFCTQLSVQASKERREAVPDLQRCVYVPRGRPNAVTPSTGRPYPTGAGYREVATNKAPPPPGKIVELRSKVARSLAQREAESACLGGCVPCTVLRLLTGTSALMVHSLRCSRAGRVLAASTAGKS